MTHFFLFLFLFLYLITDDFKSTTVTEAETKVFKIEDIENMKPMSNKGLTVYVLSIHTFQYWLPTYYGDHSIFFLFLFWSLYFPDNLQNCLF